ncbi:MAG TPA: M28 family peptidase [Candidatus Acidoferrales bacterium]|jgi:hypothetical protein|nr:M28 family peptidase [Candidatus Acidoferrales bacterium]
MRRTLLFLAIVAASTHAQLSPTAQQIALRLTPNSLKADVSFLASDALQGRGTPSPGLDIAAEFIAAQFRRAGLEPVGDDGYFQTASFESVTPNPDGLELTLETGESTVKAEKGSITLQEPAAADLIHTPVVKVTLNSPADLDALTPAQVKGNVLLIEFPEGGAAGFQAARRIPAVAAKLEAALVVLVRAGGQGPGRGPNSGGRLRDALAPSAKIPIMVVTDPAIRTAAATMKQATLSVHIAQPAAQPVKLRNVAAVLRGSDPDLKDTFVVITGHYDHLGVRGSGEGDHIYNGANDDASGTSSVIEIAAALAELPARPRRSILFMTLFGEEVGGLGSRYYCQHPIFPVAKTVADINLEQLGRTDDLEGPTPLQFNLTGFDYTNIAAIFNTAGEEAGIKVVKHETNSDAFFARSDNASFAEIGIPSTTLSVSYVFPDYHKPGDEWQKLDYDNMAKVDLAVAVGILKIANSAEAPQWNKDNPKAARYIH